MLASNEAGLEQVAAPQLIQGLDPTLQGHHRTGREDRLRSVLHAVQAQLQLRDEELACGDDLDSFLREQREKIVALFQAKIQCKQEEFKVLAERAGLAPDHAIEAFATAAQIQKLEQLEEQKSTQAAMRDALTRQINSKRNELHKLRLERVKKEPHEQMLALKKWAAAGHSPRPAEASSTQSTPAPSPGVPGRGVRRGLGQPRQDASSCTSLPSRRPGSNVDTRLASSLVSSPGMPGLRDLHTASPRLQAQQLPVDMAQPAKGVVPDGSAVRHAVVNSRHIPGDQSAAASTTSHTPSAAWFYPSDGWSSGGPPAVRSPTALQQSRV